MPVEIGDGSQMTDILFIHPGDHKRTYQELAGEFSAIATPSWTLLLAGYTRNKGYKTAVYDVNVEGWDGDTCGKLLSRHEPKLVVIMVYGHHPSASTQTMPAAGRIAKDIKKCNRHIPLAMGGVHPSALPERTIREESIDFVIQGEGPYTIEGLLAYINGKEEIKNIKGLWFKEDGEARSNAPAALVKDLDAELCDYAWDLLPSLDKYRAHNMHCFQYFEASTKDDFSDVRSPYVAMNTSLGCPYSCHYCCINSVFGSSGVRSWSVEKVLGWIDTLAGKYKVKNIRFDDELFILSPARIEKFCDSLIERDYDLNIWAYGRIDTVREPLLKKLKKAGINWICLGIESANARVRGNVNKDFRGDIKAAVRMIQSNGIYVLGNYMFGLPEEDLATMQETFDLAVDLNCEFVNFYSVMAYPGSKLYERALEKKIPLPSSWEGFSQHGCDTLPLPTDYLPAEAVLRFRDESFYKYFTSPRYLEMIGRKFGEKTVRHIEKMVSIKIKRRIYEGVYAAQKR